MLYLTMHWKKWNSPPGKSARPQYRVSCAMELNQRHVQRGLGANKKHNVGCLAVQCIRNTICFDWFLIALTSYEKWSFLGVVAT